MKYRQIILTAMCLVTPIFFIGRFQDMTNISPMPMRAYEGLNNSNGSYIKSKALTTLEDKMEKRFSLPFCNCTRYGLLLSQYGENEQSTCSDFSTQRGNHQQVFSYSYYNPSRKFSLGSRNRNKYLKQIRQRSEEVKRYFPGWLLRIYHNISDEDEIGKELLCKMFCEYDHVDLCDIRELPTLGNLMMKMPIGRLWRFAVMGDPTVSIFNSRDTDSEISMREAMVVREWLNSTEVFHVMRDHPFHLPVMLAGLWGAKNERVTKELEAYRNEMFSKEPRYQKNFDQQLLRNILWPYAKQDVMQHDSYTCHHRIHAHSRPFLTQRVGRKYVGWGPTKNRFQKFIGKNNCPVRCRPELHKDWDKC